MKPTTKGEPVYAVHPAAEAFPMLPDDELQALADDIKKNGLLLPIIVSHDDLIIDGRNRRRACELAGVKPRYETRLVQDVVAFVVATNLHRRHLTTQQRAAIAAELATLTRGANQHRGKRGSKEGPPNGGPSIKQAAKAMNVGVRTAERAKAVMQSDPAAHAAAKAGKAKPRPTPKPATTRTTSATPQSTPAPPPKPQPPSAPASPIREAAPDWYDTLCRDVLALAHAAMKANRVPAAEIVGALDDVILKLEDEGA